LELIEENQPAPSGLFFIHNDHLGTHKRLTDTQGQVVWSLQTTPFGEIHEEIANGITLLNGFPGQYRDSETGLNYNYYRDYDPSIGRYIQSDPIGLGGGLNTYGYVGGNPLRRTDPYGLSEQDVENIFNKYNDIVIYMTESGSRHPNPYLNNLGSTFGLGYLGCDDQAYVVQSSLELMPTKDTWEYEIIPGDTWTTVCVGKYCTHWQIEATSSNSNDPKLYMDPWYGSDPILIKDKK